MQVPVILAWANIQVTVYRKPNSSVNVLGEPNNGPYTTWPVINDPYGDTTHSVRIEFDYEKTEYLPTGERISQKMTLMFIDPNDDIRPQDHIVISTSDINTNLLNHFIVQSIWPEYDSVGDVNHYVAELQVP